MRLSNVRFAPLLAASFALLLLLTAAICALGLAYMSNVRTQLDTIVNELNTKTRLAAKMAVAVHQASEEMRVLPLLQDQALLQRQRAAFDQANAGYESARQQLSATRLEAEEKALLEQAKAAQEAALKVNREVINLSMESRVTEATDLMLGDAQEANRRWETKLGELTAWQDRRAQAVNAKEQRGYRWALAAMLGLGLLAFLIGGFVSWWVTRAVTAPLREAVVSAQHVAAGDLRHAVASEARNESGELLRALAKMTGSLKDVVSGVRGSAHAINGATGQLAAGASELSSRTEETASSLEQTAASMEQFGSTVAQNAGNAQQAADLASKAAATAAEGGKAFSQIVGSMSAVDESAKKIVDIIGVIDGIAFQTNILALNAAVEAARAGDQGRGFAVVAAEVRVLAQRSAAAAKEITTLIRGSAEQIGNASTIVAQASSTMQQIMSANEQVRQLISDIARASAEQNLGIAQVSSAVQQMEQVTQQNAQLVQQTAAATDAMAQEAQRLVEAVNFFEIGADKSAAAAPTSGHAQTPLPRSAPRAALTHHNTPSLGKHATAEQEEWTSF